MNIVDIVGFLAEEMGFKEFVSKDGIVKTMPDPHPVDYIGVERPRSSFQKYGKAVVIVTDKGVPIVTIDRDEVVKVCVCDNYSWGPSVKIDLRDNKIDFESVFKEIIENNS